MGGMKDLFGDTPYPASPGWKEPTTSRAAATAIASTADTVRASVLAHIKSTASTADETATALNLSVLTVRPRLSELRKAGSIEPTGERRKNASGMSAAVWRASA